MPVEPISLEAYRKVIERGIVHESQQIILQIFVNNPDRDFTNLEISDELRKPINCITGRMKELREKRYLILSQIRTQRTGYRAKAWKLNLQHETAKNTQNTLPKQCKKLNIHSETYQTYLNGRRKQ